MSAILIITSLMFLAEAATNWIAIQGLDSGGYDIGCYDVGTTIAGISLQTATDCYNACDAYVGSKTCVAAIWVNNVAPLTKACCLKQAMNIGSMDSRCTLYLPGGSGWEKGVWLQGTPMRSIADSDTTGTTCRNSCANDDQCIVGVLKLGTCYLQNSVGAPLADPDSMVVVPQPLGKRTTSTSTTTTTLTMTTRTTSTSSSTTTSSASTTTTTTTKSLAAAPKNVSISNKSNKKSCAKFTLLFVVVFLF